MCSRSRRLLFFIACNFVVCQCAAQSCEFTLEGHVIDEVSQQPLSFVNVFVEENGEGTITNEEGEFKLDDICPGEYHLVFSHIGCEAVKKHVEVFSDKVIDVLLSHSPTSLGDVVVKGNKDARMNQPSLSVNRQAIEDNTNKNLSALLENETGVHLIKNGSGISKPVVHGLYGNRLSILNNGIVQSGQQWGNDHSPEIDPYAADKIVVLKGASAIEYGGSNFGGVILVEPKPIEREPHVHGQANYIFETNGRGHTYNARLEQYGSRLAWRVNGTLKRYGDRKSANYFLNNTGLSEANLALQLEKSWDNRIFVDFYASTFNTQLGVLRGSHIGNTTDLEQALVKDVPFFTEPNFSYNIDAPKQNVSHHLAKVKGRYLINDNQKVEVVLATQLNDRKEFDIRRGDRSDIPAMSLTQFTFNSELKYTADLNNDWRFKIGNQNIVTDNTNNPETGILPLLPDYFTWRNGSFLTIAKQQNLARFNLGIRYDYEYQNVPTISSTIPREIIRFENNFHNLSALFAAKFNLSDTHTLGLSSGYAMRNPAINERYSNGLHQGVSGIELGDEEIQTEKGFKNTLEYTWLPNANFSLSGLVYHQHFEDFIFLNPQDEVQLTIRGAFPVFKYEQTDANIYGFDVSTQFTLSSSVLGQLKYSYLKGEDVMNSRPLVYMPPNSLFGSLTYRVKQALTVTKNFRLEDTEMDLNYRSVFEQTNITAEQDFAAPPSAYSLLGAKVSTNVIFTRHKIRCFIKGDNLFNVAYRDYLNRQRYFSDDLGVSVTFGLNYKF